MCFWTRNLEDTMNGTGRGHRERGLAHASCISVLNAWLPNNCARRSVTPARVRKLRSSRSSRGAELPRGPGDCRLAAAQASRSARSPWSCSTGGTVITIINNYRMQIAQEGALAKPWGNCSLDLGAEAWQGDRAYVRRDLRGETECRGWLPSALSSRSLRASPGLLPARRGAGRGGGGGESPQFSSLGSSPEEALGRRGLGKTWVW